MDKSERRVIERALHAAGFVPVGSTRHTEVWRDRTRTFVMPRDHGVSDSRHADEQRAKLRRMGIAV